jgi:hypothetical protein
MFLAQSRHLPGRACTRHGARSVLATRLLPRCSSPALGGTLSNRNLQSAVQDRTGLGWHAHPGPASLASHPRAAPFHSAAHPLRAVRPFLLADIGEGITECEVIAL